MSRKLSDEEKRQNLLVREERQREKSERAEMSGNVILVRLRPVRF